MSRFVKRTRSELSLPACSIVSRTDTDEWFIDLGYDMDYYGTMYIGKTDFDEMAKLVNYAPADELLNTIEELKNELDKLTAERDELASFRRAVVGSIKITGNNKRVSEPAKGAATGNSEAAVGNRELSA